jgi:hypothetical protein
MVRAPIFVVIRKAWNLAQREIAETKLKMGRASRSTISEPYALHTGAHRDQRHQQSDAAEQDYRTEIITEKLRGLLKLGDHSDECGHGILALLLLSSPKRTRMAKSDFILPNSADLLCEFVHSATQA